MNQVTQEHQQPIGWANSPTALDWKASSPANRPSARWTKGNQAFGIEGMPSVISRHGVASKKSLTCCWLGVCRQGLGAHFL